MALKRRFLPTRKGVKATVRLCVCLAYLKSAVRSASLAVASAEDAFACAKRTRMFGWSTPYACACVSRACLGK